MLKVSASRESDIRLVLDLKVPSKKNSYIPKSGRFIKPQSIRNFETACAFSIPNEYKNLKLRHPDIMISAAIPKTSWRSDRDNSATAILDILVKNGVLHDDSINHNNGILVLNPVTLSDTYQTIVDIWINNN